MVNNKSSQTALVVCFIRAASYFEKIPQLKNKDFLAQKFIPGVFKLLFKFESFRRYFQRKLPYGSYEYIVARTKYLDSVFQYAVNNKFEQIVILGAGFDTRAIRLNKDNKIKVFEVDTPATQIYKINKLKKTKIEINQNLVFVPFDLNQFSLKETLKRSNLEKKKTLFIMEGLLMYLEPSAVDSLFKNINEFSKSGSEIVFDYIYSSVVNGEEKETKGSDARQIVSQVNESWHFGIKRGEIKSFLKTRNFELIENLDGANLIKKYFYKIPKNIEIRVSDIHSITRAKIIKK